jgi:hypothetical protein
MILGKNYPKIMIDEGFTLFAVRFRSFGFGLLRWPWTYCRTWRKIFYGFCTHFYCPKPENRPCSYYQIRYLWFTFTFFMEVGR